MPVPDATIKQQILNYLEHKSKEKDFDITDLTFDGIKARLKFGDERLERCLDDLVNKENLVETQGIEMEIYKLPGQNLEKHKKFFTNTASNLFMGLIITSIIIYIFPGVITFIKSAKVETEIGFLILYMWVSFMCIGVTGHLFSKCYLWILSKLSIFTKINKKALSTIFVTIIILVALAFVLTKYVFKEELTTTITLMAIGLGIPAGAFVWNHVVKGHI